MRPVTTSCLSIKDLQTEPSQPRAICEKAIYGKETHRMGTTWGWLNNGTGLGDLSKGAERPPLSEIHLLCKLHFRFRLAQLAARLKTN